MKIKLDLTYLDGPYAKFGSGLSFSFVMDSVEWRKLNKPTTIEVEINVP